MIRPLPDMSDCVRFASRGSALALAQTNSVIARFRDVHPEIEAEVEVVRTEGDLDKVSPLTEIGGRGVFTSGLEAAIVRGRVDAAVHSAKDLPSTLHPDVPIVAFLDRDDARDVLVSRHGTSLVELPPNPVIGTSSRRREAQIRQLRPDARIASIRGNIDTRLGKAAGPDFDAIVLAAAGIRRMGWSDRITEVFAVDRLVPSPGQGAIAVQARLGSAAAGSLAAIDEPAVSAAVKLERVFLAAVGAGCSYPVAAYVTTRPVGFHLQAMLADPTGTRVEHAAEVLRSGEEEQHIASLARRLMDAVGLDRKPRAWPGSGNGRDLAGARVVVTRARRQAQSLNVALAGRGATVLSLPTIRIEPVADSSALDAAILDIRSRQIGWIAFASANAVEAVGDRLAALAISPQELAAVSIAAIGGATAAAVERLGLRVSLIPECASAEGLVAALRERLPTGSYLLYPHSTIGRDVVPTELRAAGIDVTAVAAYRTVPETSLDPAVMECVRGGDADVIAFTSPSSVHALTTLIGPPGAEGRRTPAVCAGPVTAAAARDAGFPIAAVSEQPDASALTETIAAWWRGQRESRERPDDRVVVETGGRSGRA
jgi:hydroxymethylbilane synthase